MLQSSESGNDHLELSYKTTQIQKVSRMGGHLQAVFRHSFY